MPCVAPLNKIQSKWFLMGPFFPTIWYNNMGLNYINSFFYNPLNRHMQPTYFLHRHGRIIDYVYQKIWRKNTVWLKLIGWKICGAQTVFSRTQNLLHSKLWPFRIIICGYIVTKRFFIWWNWLCGYLVPWTLLFIHTTLKSVNYKWKAVSQTFWFIYFEY